MPWLYDPVASEVVEKHVYLARKAQRSKRASRHIAMPYVAGDIKPYTSPVTGKPVESRSARREDLKRSGCREVDPSEFKPVYRNYEFCQSKRLPYMGGDVPPPMNRDEKMAVKERKAKEKARTAEVNRRASERAARDRDPKLASFLRGAPKGKPIFKNNTVPANLEAR